MYTDTCAGPSIPVGSAAEAVAAMSTANGIEVVEQTNVTIGGYPGSRLDIYVPDAPNTRPDLQIPVADGLNPLDPTGNFALYFIDVQGKTLGLALYGSNDWNPDVRAAVDAILASMQIEP